VPLFFLAVEKRRWRRGQWFFSWQRRGGWGPDDHGTWFQARKKGKREGRETEFLLCPGP
jgi:hypothetical protein